MENANQMPDNTPPGKTERYYCAPLWKRLIAFLLDYVFAHFISLAFSLFAGIFLGYIRILFFKDMELTEETMETPALISFIVVAYFYFVIMEASPWRATFGKKIMKIIVTGDEGQKMTFLKSLLRNFGKFISIIFLGIGCLFALFTEKRQTLYDLAVESFVVDTLENLEDSKPPELITENNPVKELH